MCSSFSTRDTRLTDVLAALRICRSLGIELRPSLLPFTPWSTLGDQIDLLDLIAGNDLIDSVDPVQLSIRLLVPPGSLLLALPEMREHLRGYDPDGFSHLWQHPDPVMDALQADIAALVAADTDAGVSPRVHACCDPRGSPLGRPPAQDWPGRDAGAPLPPERDAPPRLSEPWFCCAEPTTAQLAGAGVALGA